MPRQSEEKPKQKQPKEEIKSEGEEESEKNKEEPVNSGDRYYQDYQRKAYQYQPRGSKCWYCGHVKSPERQEKRYEHHGYERKEHREEFGYGRKHQQRKQEDAKKERKEPRPSHPDHAKEDKKDEDHKHGEHRHYEHRGYGHYDNDRHHYSPYRGSYGHHYRFNPYRAGFNYEPRPYNRDYNYCRVHTKTDFERGSGEIFDKDFYAKKSDKDSRPKQEAKEDKKEEIKEKPAKEERKDFNHYERHEARAFDHKQYDHYRHDHHRKYYSPHRLHAHGGGEHHHRHLYDYQRVPHHGEYEPYVRHNLRADFERARSGDRARLSDEVNYDPSPVPNRKYFKFEDRHGYKPRDVQYNPKDDKKDGGSEKDKGKEVQDKLAEDLGKKDE